MSLNRILKSTLVTLAVTAASGCNSGSSAPTAAATPTPTPTNVSATAFLSQLVSDAQSGAVPAAYANSTVLKANSLQPGFFVIYDSATGQDMAINLGYPGEVYDLTKEQIVQAFVESDQHLNGNTTFSNGSTVGFSSGTQTFDYSYYPQYIDKMGNLVEVTADPQQNPGVYVDGAGELYSQESQTRDTDLQQAQLQNQTFLQRAANVSTTYSMSFSSALQVTLLADKINTLGEQQMTDEDRQAMTQSMMNIAGLKPEDISKAVTSGLQGDLAPANALVSQAAQNLGMPSDATIRNKILPALGVNLTP